VIVASGRIASQRMSRVAGVAVVVVGAALAIRGVALQVLLATNTGGLRATIGPLETRWSLALWNPWFAIGGALFLWTAIRIRRVLTWTPSALTGQVARVCSSSGSARQVEATSSGVR